MRKLFYILLLLVLILIVWLVTKRSIPTQPQAQLTNTIIETQTPSPLPQINSHGGQSNASVAASQPDDATEAGDQITNALTATNIEQWKTLIKGLHKMSGLSESWHMEETNPALFVSIPLNKNDQSITYKVRFADISIKNGNGDILEVQLRSPMMNIDETRELGLQLCKILGCDSMAFQAWCDKVGNHWLDTPLYGTKGNRYMGFETFRTSNDEKPWSISFLIMNP